MRTIAVINQKGGVGKTTVSINLASCLAIKGKKTLLVDMDPQSHCAVGLAVPEEQIEQSIYDVLVSTSRNSQMAVSEVIWQICDNFELAPSTIDLAAFEQQMAGVMGREKCLKNILETVKNDYDYVVIDCPPSVGLLTFNAIRAASDVIVPVETGYFSLHGLSKQLETLSVLSKQCEQDINVMVLASMYDIRTKMSREILAELRRHFENKMFKTVINFNTKLKEAASLGQPISEYDSSSKGCKDFMYLADELISTDTLAERKEMVSTLSRQLAAISSSADEILATIKMPPTSVSADQVEPAALATDTICSVDTKIAQFYGVRQEEDVVSFVTLYPTAASVQVAGDFNNWQPESAVMEKIGENGAWSLKLNIEPGCYQYRLVVDGQWQQDPYNEAVEVNPFGEYNSVLTVA